ADNLEFLAVLSITPAEFLTDGIAIGKEISRHRLIDACDPWGGVGVGRQKLAARQHTSAEGLEEAGSDGVQIEPHVLVRAWRVARGVDSVSQAAAASDGKHERQAGRAHGRYGDEPLEDLPVEIGKGRALIACLLGVDRE